MRQTTDTKSRTTYILGQQVDEDVLTASDVVAYGGAKTLDEVAAYEEAAEFEDALTDFADLQKSIITNIVNDDTLSPAERADAIANASKEFAEIAEQVQGEKVSAAVSVAAAAGVHRGGGGGGKKRDEDPAMAKWRAERDARINTPEHKREMAEFTAKRDAKLAAEKKPKKDGEEKPKKGFWGKLSDKVSKGDAAPKGGGGPDEYNRDDVGRFAEKEYDDPEEFLLDLAEFLEEEFPGVELSMKERDYNRDESGRFASGSGGGAPLRGFRIWEGSQRLARLSRAPLGATTRMSTRLKRDENPEAKRHPRAVERIIPPVGSGRKPPPTEYVREKPVPDPSRKHDHGYDNQRGAYGHQHEYDYAHQHKDFKDGDMIASEDAQGAFAAFKDTSGAWRWAATWSNNFVDRDNEVFPENAHKEYEAYVDKSQDYPELWLWHVPGSKSGKADMIAYDDGFCLATGTFDEDKSDIAEALSRAKDIGVSHGYTYSPAEVRGGQYLRYRTFEISPLPGAKASNIGTSFAAMKEAPMLTAEKREWLVKTIGEDRATAIEENHQRMRKELTDRGISYKEFVEALAEAPDDEATTAAASTEETPGIIESPGGFVSTDGGETWKKAEKAGGAANFGGKKAPNFGKDGKPADDDEEDEDGKKNPFAKKEADVIDTANIGEVMASALKTALEPITSQIKEMHDEFTTKIDAVKSGRDDVIAQAWSHKSWGREVKSATEADTNLLDAEKARAALASLNGEAEGNDPAMPYIKDLMSVLGNPALSA